MATIINNQASLAYQYGTTSATALSNIATAVIEDALTVTKTAVADTYTNGNEITYTVTVSNNSTSTLTNVTLTDNLASYTTENGTTVTPLTYTGPSLLFTNGAYTSAVTPNTAGDSAVFTIPSLAPGSNALIVYRAVPNTFADGTTGSTLTNTVSASADGVTEPATASDTVTVRDYADVRIVKSMTPASLTDGDTITYTFMLYNYGNTDATDVVLTDTFNPAPNITSITVNGIQAETGESTYTASTVTVPAPGSRLSITVPAAQYARDETTGEVATVPGVTEIVITGTL